MATQGCETSRQHESLKDGARSSSPFQSGDVLSTLGRTDDLKVEALPLLSQSFLQAVKYGTDTVVQYHHQIDAHNARLTRLRNPCLARRRMFYCTSHVCVQFILNLIVYLSLFQFLKPIQRQTSSNDTLLTSYNNTSFTMSNVHNPEKAENKLTKRGQTLGLELPGENSKVSSTSVFRVVQFKTGPV